MRSAASPARARSHSIRNTPELRDSVAKETPPLPSPWSVEELDACFDREGQRRRTLAYFYFEPGLERRSAVKLLARDDARRIASNFAKLPTCWAGVE
jgi:hypothetical protein